MEWRALVSVAAFLSLTGGADAQTQFDEHEFLPSMFLRQAPEDYLPIEVDLERQGHRGPAFTTCDAGDGHDLATLACRGEQAFDNVCKTIAALLPQRFAGLRPT